MTSAIARFTDSLTEDERKSIRDEAAQFFQDDSAPIEERLKKLQLIESFLLEVMRLNGPFLVGNIHISGFPLIDITP